MIVAESEHDGFHGNNERVNIEAFKRGMSNDLAIIREVVYD